MEKTVRLRRGLITLCAGLLFSFSSTLVAYNPDIHRQLASFAMSKILKLLSLPEPHEELAQISADEDSGEDTSLRAGLQRITNWHFYNPFKEDRQQCCCLCICINRSMTEVVRQRQKDLLLVLQRSDSTFKDFALYYGRCMHFIEDVTVPAHVTPVFHGPAFPGAASGHSWPTIIHDAFDGYPIDMGELERQWQEFQENSELFSLVWSIGNLPALLQQLFMEPVMEQAASLVNTIDINKSPVHYCIDIIARLTLMRNPSPQDRSKTYWSEDTGHEYFCGYGASFDELNEQDRRQFVNKQHFLATVAVVVLGIHLWRFWHNGCSGAGCG